MFSGPHCERTLAKMNSWQLRVGTMNEFLEQPVVVAEFLNFHSPWCVGWTRRWKQRVSLCSLLPWCKLAQCVWAAGPPVPPSLVFGRGSLSHMDAPMNVCTHTAVCTSIGAEVYLGACIRVIVTMALGLTQAFEAGFWQHMHLSAEQRIRLLWSVDINLMLCFPFIYCILEVTHTVKQQQAHSF